MGTGLLISSYQSITLNCFIWHNWSVTKCCFNRNININFILLHQSPINSHTHYDPLYTDTVGRDPEHMSPDLVCGASAQNQAAKLFWFFREDDGYNETFSAAKCFIIVLKVSFMWKYANDSIKEMKWWIITILFYFTFPFIKYKHCNIVTISSVRGRLILSTCTAHTAGRHVLSYPCWPTVTIR